MKSPRFVAAASRGSIGSYPTVTSVVERSDGLLGARLSDGALLSVDHITLATAYAADLARVPYLSGVLDEVRMVGGLAVLDEQFRTTVPGLHITGFAATRAFGPFFGSLRGASAAASMIAAALTGAPGGGAPRLAPARPARRRPRGTRRALADTGRAARPAARRSVG